MDKIHATLTIDTSGKCCPMPVIETNKALKQLNAGDILEIIATDVGTLTDIPSLCNRQGHTLLSSSKQNDVLIYYVRKNR